MRKICIFFLFLFSTTVAVVAGVHRVGTYNIRTTGMSADSLERAWSKRKASVVKMIRDTMNFDVVALQEVSNQQHNYLRDQLGDVYSYYDGPSSGNEVLYRKSKYTCLDKGYYYLAPDPTKSGAAWDAQQTRYGCWVKLQDKESGEIFFFCGTHLDLYPISIREGARVNAEQMRKIAGNYPCVITGDMNCEPLDRDPHANFAQYLGDAREMCKTTPKGSYYTFNSGMNPSASGKRRLDYLYVHNVDVESYWTNPSTLGRTLTPSDHLPTMCEITPLPKLRATTHVVNNVAELRQAVREVQVDDLIHLNEGRYDLEDSTLVIINTCAIEGDDNVVLTGATQLLCCNQFSSLELRNLRFQDATCTIGKYGSVAYAKGNYLKLTDCVIEYCQTTGEGLIYAEDCSLTVDRCLFRNNSSPYRSCGLVQANDQSGQSGYSLPLILTNSTFTNNTANYGSAVYNASTHSAYIANNSFANNMVTERGCIFINNESNNSDIRLVNNTLINNSIDVASGRKDAIVGGSSIWQNMASSGYLTLVNNTIVGNYTACRTATGQSSAKFQSGTIHSASGKLKLYNNVIAGNYSSCPGRGDISLVDSTKAVGGYNVLSSVDNTNYSMATTDMKAATYAVSLNELVSLYGGVVEDSVYHAPLQYYGDNQVLALSPRTVRYARANMAVVDETARSAATIGSDILNSGSKKGTLTTDQIGTTRKEKSVPGAMEVGQIPTSLDHRLTDSPTYRFTKVLIGDQLYIIHNNVRYNAQGLQQ